MNDFLAHNSNVQSFRAEMAGKTVLETKASSDARSGSGETAATIVRETAPADDADVEQRLTSVAEMAEAQAKVAALLAELHAVRDAAAFDADAVETQISAVLPRPTVIVPLPPANRDAVQQAIEIAERIRASAAVAFSAQANVHSGFAEGLLA